MVCLAPRALKDSVRPRRLAGVVVRPLNFTVRRPWCRIARFGVVVTSKLLRGLAAFAMALSAGLVTTFVLGFLVPWGFVALKWGLGPGAGDAVFVVMLLAVPIAGLLSMMLVFFLTAILYGKLSPPPPPRMPTGV